MTIQSPEWQRHGLIFAPSGEHGWMNSHAQVPTVLPLHDRLRVYFATRPEAGLSMTTFVDLDLSDPRRILYLHDRPILELGRPGTFDEHGIMPAAVLQHNNEVLLYYSGWSRCTSVPYTNSTGLARSRDGGLTFERVYEGPVMGRSHDDPFSATSPAVIREGNDWHMWYCSGRDWLVINGKYEHVYNIKHAISRDGHIWKSDREPAIPQSTPTEALTRATVYKSTKGWHMWFCHRGSHDFRDGNDAYRLGYAFSEDLISWIRSNDKGGLEPGCSGWDSKMIAYPDVIELNNKLAMFYNGNSFGESGFGFATIDYSLYKEYIRIN